MNEKFYILEIFVDGQLHTGLSDDENMHGDSDTARICHNDAYSRIKEAIDEERITGNERITARTSLLVADHNAGRYIQRVMITTKWPDIDGDGWKRTLAVGKKRGYLFAALGMVKGKRSPRYIGGHEASVFVDEADAQKAVDAASQTKYTSASVVRLNCTRRGKLTLPRK